MKKKGIILGALVLTGASIITRILGFVYRIYMSNAIGAEGMGLYQLISPIYGLAWSISCSGITTTVSKLIAQENAKRQYGNMGRILKQALFLTTFLGLTLGVLLFFFTDYISVGFFHDTRTTLALKILSLSFPFMAAGSCIRGYFFGLQETRIPAISQVFEQFIRMAAIFMLANTFIPMGLGYACAAAVIGILAGEILSFIFVILAYKLFKKKNSLNSKPTFTPIQSITLILTMAVPLTANRVTGSLLSTLEDVLIPQRLQAFGLSASEAISVFGRITGMAMPLIYFPSAFLTSLSISLVPAISEAQAVDNKKRIIYTASKSLMLTSIIGMGASAIFITFNNELGRIIYNQDIGQMLMLLGLMCPFLYLQVTMSGILNGLSQQVFIFQNSLLSSAINLLFIYFFMPDYGINAFIAGWFVSLLVTCSLSIHKISCCIDIKFDINKWFLLPLISALASGLTMKYIFNRYISLHVHGTTGLIVSICVLGLSYFVFTMLTGCITLSDIKVVYSSLRLPRIKRHKYWIV